MCVSQMDWTLSKEVPRRSVLRVGNQRSIQSPTVIFDDRGSAHDPRSTSCSVAWAQTLASCLRSKVRENSLPRTLYVACQRPFGRLTTDATVHLLPEHLSLRRHAARYPQQIDSALLLVRPSLDGTRVKAKVIPEPQGRGALTTMAPLVDRADRYLEILRQLVDSPHGRI